MFFPIFPRASIFVSRYSARFGFLLVIALLVIAACNKSAEVDPCEGLLNEGPPRLIGFRLVDRLTGENIVLRDSIRESDIHVGAGATGDTSLQGNMERNINSPYHGWFWFPQSVFRAGLFRYRLELPGYSPVSLSHTNTLEAVDEPCQPAIIRSSDVNVSADSFTVTRAGSRMLVEVYR